jgi:hypothetical protein
MYASFFLLLVYRVNVCAMCYSLGAEEERKEGGDHEMSRGKKIPNCKNHLLVIWISSHRFRCLGWPDYSFLEKCKLSFQGMQSKLGCLLFVWARPSEKCWK